jgi:hypothetical protein
MLKNFRFAIIAVAAIFMMASCGNEAADSAATDARTAVTTPAAAPAATNPAAKPVATPPAAPAGPTTAVSFKETEFNFGKVVAGEKVSHTYTFTNTGNEPLIISNAKGSCGCTVPEWPREPIAVGGTGEVTVVFDSKNKKGPRNQKVTLTANTDPPQTFIYLKGEVEPDPNAPAAKTPNVQVQ